MIMTTSRTFSAVVLGSAFLLLPAHESTQADQVEVPVVSPGATATRGGSLLNVGQAAVGLSRSTMHTMSAGGLPGMLHLAVSRVKGDLDGDGDADQADHAIFVLCMAGPRVSVPPRGCTQEQFDLADVQADRDVDLGDYGEIAPVLSVD